MTPTIVSHWRALADMCIGAIRLCQLRVVHFAAVDPSAGSVPHAGLRPGSGPPIS